MDLRPLPVLLSAILALPSCGALSSLNDASRALEIYELRPAEPQAGRFRAVAAELVVEEPVASGSLATERIMVRPAPLRAEYLPDVRWADTVPIMLQTLLVRSISATNAVSSVGRAPLGASGDFALLTELTDFQAEADTDTEAAIVRLRVIARIVREADAEVIASRVFEVVEAAPSSDTQVLIDAFDRASARFLTEIVGWLVPAVRGAR